MMKAKTKKITLYAGMHLCAVICAVLISVILFGSSITVSFISGEKTYSLDAYSFSDDSKDRIITDIFSSQASDIMRYIASCRILDSFERLDIGREIDVSGYYHGDNPVSFKLSMSELINMGRRDIQFTDRNMQVSDFISYFGDLPSDEGSDEYLRNLILKYPDFVSIVKNEGSADNIIYVEPVIGADSEQVLDNIFKAADSWDDYFSIISELKNASVIFAGAYDVYSQGSGLYSPQNKSNLHYVFKVRENSGTESVYTDSDEADILGDEELSDYYSVNERYIICFYDELKYMSSPGLGEYAVTDVLRSYPDVFPNETHIWISLDGGYPVRDIYYEVNYRYDALKNKDRLFTVLIALLFFIWLYFLIKLINSAGVSETSDGTKEIILPQDRVYFEFIILFAIAAVYMFSYYAQLLGDSYIASALLGLLVSISISFVLFTIVRRIRAGVFYEYTLIKTFRELFERFALNLSGRSKATVTVLIPYLLFLLLNLTGESFCILFYESHRVLVAIAFVLLIMIDIYAGITLFLNTAEKKKLFEGVERIRGGETDYKIDVQKLRAENRDLAESINNIGEGIDIAVKESLLEENLRTELITNVSHDIKTPLTSIINYADILNSKDVSDEKRREYLEIIGDKSKRLKKLLEDLLEASKLSSGRMEMNKEKTNLSELLNQALGEYEDRFAYRKLEVICGNMPTAYINADAGAIWRIFNNLFENICKYAMNDTKVHVNMIIHEGECSISVKNISAMKLRYQGNELTERFIRGDESRTGEGSGLGLFIAKSLVEANDGRFDVVVDGDLFTVLINFIMID